jgi:hypothetical protein
MYSRYRRRITDAGWTGPKRGLFSRIEPNQWPGVLVIVSLLVAIPITKFALEHVPLYERNFANGFGVIRAEQGMVTEGLWHDPTGPCKSAYRLSGVPADIVLCSHGPDPAPPGFNIYAQPAPLISKAGGQLAGKERNVLGVTVACDGDGVAGKRVEVLYAHASDVEDNSSIYLNTFQQYVANMDSMFDTSASETGGSRQIRFVHSATCLPKVTDVQLSPTGDDTFSNTVAELEALGYNRPDRKYLVFVDAHVYCGIGTLYPDDSPGEFNKNNSGPSYGRVDSGCWSGTIAAHELMHTLGGVQLSAPHSNGSWHCTDEYDRMCYSDRPMYPVMHYVCNDPDRDILFDCNHDDYFSTNVMPGSYLDTHWNSANSDFLIDTSYSPH